MRYSKTEQSRLKDLNRGWLQSSHFIEIFRIDFATLFYSIAPFVSTSDLELIKKTDSQGIIKRMNIGAKTLSKYFTLENLTPLKQHRSDTVRGWVAFMIGSMQERSLAQKLSEIRSLANDSHFAVREWSWLAMRKSIGQDIHSSITQLLPWTLSKSVNIRRFAIESTRPRGVWSQHITELKHSPEIGRILLEAVMVDRATYVQKSCGNWLNDAAKTNPKWVIEFCQNWEQKTNDPVIRKIVKRGLRNIL